MIVAGVGFRRGCAADGLAAVVRLAETASGLRADALAAPRFKAGEPGLHGAAALLGVPLLLVADGALQAAQPRCPTRSGAALRATGVASVAEGSALAASGGCLLLPRVVLDGATCALAGPLLGFGDAAVPGVAHVPEHACAGHPLPTPSEPGG